KIAKAVDNANDRHDIWIDAVDHQVGPYGPVAQVRRQVGPGLAEFGKCAKPGLSRFDPVDDPICGGNAIYRDVEPNRVEVGVRLDGAPNLQAHSGALPAFICASRRLPAALISSADRRGSAIPLARPSVQSARILSMAAALRRSRRSVHSATACRAASLVVA